MNPTIIKWTILGTAVAGIIAIAKLALQSRAAREAREAAAAATAALAELRRESEERAARHAREMSERAEEAVERKAEREQRDRLFAELQDSNEKTLDFLKAQLKTQQESGAKRYEIIERGNANLAMLAAACAVQGQELRVLVDRIAKIEGGAGCRARSN